MINTQKLIHQHTELVQQVQIDLIIKKNTETDHRISCHKKSAFTPSHHYKFMAITRFCAKSPRFTRVPLGRLD